MFSRFVQFCRLWAGDTRGNLSIVAAASLGTMAIVAGASIDFARASGAKSLMQGALDSAVLSAVQVETSQRSSIAGKVFDVAFLSSALGTATVVWTNNADGSFSGNATIVIENTLMKLARQPTTTVGAKATAIREGGAVSPPQNTGGASCIYLLAANTSQALLVNSPVTLNAPSCRVEVFSQANPAAIFNGGFTHNLQKICVKGANVIENGGQVTALEKNCTPNPDPFDGNMPAVSVGNCTVSNQNYAGNNTLLPGVYCGNFNFNGAGTLNLSPGLYILKNTRWNLNSGWKVNGNGVTFYLADANSYIQINSGVAVDISAPDSGTYKNILMFEPQGLQTSQFTINGSAGHDFEGLFYLPSRNVTFNSVSSVQSEKITMVFNTLILNHIDWAFQDSGAPRGSSGTAGGTSSGPSASTGMQVRLLH